MSLAHLTLPTRDVERTAAFFERTFGYTRGAAPGNSPMQTLWLDIGGGQQLHVLRVEGFEVSPFEHEFGRHVAVYYPEAGFPTLKARLLAEGAEIMAPERATSYARFFLREPVNGYVFEVIASEAQPRAIHLDQ